MGAANLWKGLLLIAMEVSYVDSSGKMKAASLSYVDCSGIVEAVNTWKGLLL